MFSNSGLAARTQAFILAGGEGRRLYPLTRYRAKPVIPVGGVYRLVDFTLSNCLNSGLSRINILTQYECDSLHSYVRALTGRNLSGRKGAESVFCLCPVSGKRYRGTADAVFQNLPVLEHPKADLVVILSADHVYKMDYRELLSFHVEHGAEVTVAALEYPAHAASQFGVLETDAEGRAVGFEEKPRKPKRIAGKPADALVSMGVYVFNTKTLIEVLSADATQSSTHDFGKDIIPGLVRNHQVSVFDFTKMGTRLGAYWRDVGTLETYYRVNMELLMSSYFDAYASAGWPLYGLDRNSYQPPAAASDRPTGFVADSIVPEGVSIDPAAQVVHSILSPGVRIEGSAIVQNSILFHDVRVGSGARIRRAIVDEHSHIDEGVEVGFDINSDRQFGLVTESELVVIHANTYVGIPHNPSRSGPSLAEFIGDDPFKTQRSR